jgi:hypothetical protein
MSLIHADILGGYGHGELQAAAGAMTIIEADDVADRLSNRRLYPTWNADKGKMINAWPKRMDLWAEYEELVVRAINDEENEAGSAMDVAEAHAYYLEHRAEMDAGAEISSEHLHLPREGEPQCQSALEYAMAFRIQIGDPAFQAECQNTPRRTASTPLLVISPFMVQSRTSGIPRRIVPDSCTRIFLGVDIGKGKLHAVAMATPAAIRQGHIVDYGIWPIQAVEGDARRRDTEAYQALDRAVYQALVGLRQRLEAEPYRYADGRACPIDLACCDVRFMPDAVNRFCDERNNWISFMGVNSRTWPRPSETCRVSAHIYARLNGIDGSGQLRWRHYQNSDTHKRFVHEGFRIDSGQPGSIALFGSRMSEHREYAEHICAESYIETGPNEFKWVSANTGAENHLLDCTGLCFVGASRRSLKTFGHAGDLMPGTAPEEPAEAVAASGEAQDTKGTTTPVERPTPAPAKRIRQSEALNF